MNNPKHKHIALLTMLMLIMTLMMPGLSTAAPDIVDAGDQVLVSLPGETAFEQPFDVDRRGQIMLPEVGLLTVAGMTEEEMAQAIRERISDVYLNLDNLQVYVYSKRMIITVQGYVKEPGEYILPEYESIQSAFHAAGGLRKGAQLNRIQLIREDGMKNFDYKQYLDTGRTDLLPALRSLDTLFVPASPMTGNVEVEFDPSNLTDAGDAAEDRKAIKVFGEVNHPGSFSYRKDINIVDLLMRAGGVTRYAGVEQIRVINGTDPVLFNLKTYLDTGNASLMPTMSEGATVFVPRQEEEIKTGSNVVYVMGEVAKPGAYESKEDATFMDILANAGGPTRFAESRQIRIIKSDGGIVDFDLAGYTEGTTGEVVPGIGPGDAIFVPEKTDMNEKSWLKVAPDRAVRVIGEVVRPGRIEWSDEMDFLDLLAHVGGPKSRADTSTIEVVTPMPDGSSSITVFDLDAFIKRGGSDDELPMVRAGTTIRIHDLPVDPKDNKSQWVRQASDKSIYVFGQVGAPGRYKFDNSMNFLDILSAADGPTHDADIHHITISHRDKDRPRVTHVNLSLYFQTGDESLIPKVRTGDTIYVPEKDRQWLDKPKELTVRVLGAVNKPGRYTFSDEMTILDLLAEAGGTSNVALVEKISVVNLSCCKNQARTFDLADFSRTADFDSLPVLRAGDTVYVPNKEDSDGEVFRKGLRDVFQIVTLGLLIGGI